MDFVYFLGRFHVLLLHLPIGILLLAVALEVASRFERFRYLAPALNAVWLLGAITAIGTVALGYMHASEGGFDSAAVNSHRIAGTSLAVSATAVWLLRARFADAYDRSWVGWSVLVVALLFVTGHYGGNLTHGDTYLALYAPAPLRHLMGVSDEHLPRSRPTDVASADIYLDVVSPTLQQRCGTCHNDSKRKGGLSVASYASLMKGGEHGAVIVARDPKGSDLTRRISLMPEDKDFMPREGKTPLTAEQTAAIHWWVAAGAPRSASIASLKPPAKVLASLQTTLGFRARKASAGTDVAATGTPTAPLADVPPPDARVLDMLESKGFSVRAITVDSPFVQVDYTASRPMDDTHFAELAKIGHQIYSLNLRSAGVTDAQLATVSRFDHLVKLRLELNPVSDAGVKQLATLTKLESLNLYGTRISNAALASLASISGLRELFLWQTAVTPAGIAEFRRTHAGVRVDDGFDPRTFPEGPKVIPVVN